MAHGRRRAAAPVGGRGDHDVRARRSGARAPTGGRDRPGLLQGPPGLGELLRRRLEQGRRRRDLSGERHDDRLAPHELAVRPLGALARLLERADVGPIDGAAVRLIGRQARTHLGPSRAPLGQRVRSRGQLCRAEHEPGQAGGLVEAELGEDGAEHRVTRVGGQPRVLPCAGRVGERLQA